MRRLGRIRVQYLVAVALAIGIGAGIYALRGSQSSAPALATTPVLTSVPARPAAPVVAPVPAESTAPATSTAPRVSKRRPTSAPHPAIAQRTVVPSAVALLARVRSAYVHVPAVVVTGTLVKARLRLVFILHNGRIVADGWLGTGANGEVIGAVTPAGSPTLARELGTRCWRPLAASNVLSSTDIGAAFPPALSTFGTPARSRGGWAVSGEDSNGALTGFVIDPKTFKLRSMTSSQGGLGFTGTVDALGSVPALPVPEPRC